MPRPPGAFPQTTVSAIVLCGGTSRRMGGVDKTRESLASTTVLDYLLDALPRAWSVVCVGEERATSRAVQWCRESPAGGGPVAGIAAGLRHLEHPADPERLDAEIHRTQIHGTQIHGAQTHDNEICVVVGGDMPFAAAALPALVEALTAGRWFGAVLAIDPDDCTQPLLAAYRVEALRRALPREPGGARLMSVVDALLTDTLACEAPITLDVDTPEALEQARRIVGT